jgi:glyoxylase-like metal-dependent hydrolase (beta-lactamase superfamily II)
VATEIEIAPWTDLGEGITQIRLPMAGNPLRYINGYLLEDDAGATLVDCGWRAPDVLAALEAALAARGLGVEGIARLVITHHHYDHYGLAATLRRRGVPELHMHRLDWERAQRFDEYHTEFEALADAWLARNGYTGLPDDEHISDRAELAEPTHFADDGTVIGRLVALWTPGHAPGHLCYADTRSGRMLTGDHVLDPITPHVGVWFDGASDPLGDYLASLERVARHGATGALPAHGEPFPDLPGRARAIAAHTHDREALILARLGDREMTAGALAAEIPWTRRERTFASLSPFHQQFAVGETIAHLEHLRARGVVKRNDSVDRNRYARRT